MLYQLTSTTGDGDFRVPFRFGNKLVRSARDVSLALETTSVVFPGDGDKFDVENIHGNSVGMRDSDLFYHPALDLIRGVSYKIQVPGVRRMILSHNLYPSTIGAEDHGYAVLIELMQDINDTGKGPILSPTLQGHWQGSIGFASAEKLSGIRKRLDMHCPREYYPYVTTSRSYFADRIEREFGVDWHPLGADVKLVK